MKQRMAYFECPKGNFHESEILNIICIEPGCENKLLCCNVCVSEDHRKHMTKSLKMFLSESRGKIENVVKTSINVDAFMEMISENRTNNLEKLLQCKTQVLNSFDHAFKDIQNYYKQIIAKIKVLTTSSMNDILIGIFQEIEKKTTPLDLMREIQRIISYLPSQSAYDAQKNIKEESLILSLKNSNIEIQLALSKLKSENRLFFKQFKSKLKAGDIFAQRKFQFSPIYKHPHVQLINSTTVKATDASGYKFAIMEPHLETNQTGIKEYAFKIKENSASNWIAVGMCHKEIIIKNQYDFKYSNLGHGAYMVSSNAGTWSNTESDKNNLVKAFYFYKNDVIFIKVDFDQKKIKFLKKGSDSSYQLNFTLIPQDPLCPCVLFYYDNDEIEYIQSHVEEQTQ